jgi:hypothetical protein
MRAVGRPLRAIQFRQPPTGLPLDAQQVLAFSRSIRPPPRQRELMLGEGDQLVEAAGRKFPRSVMNSTTCSRSHANSVMA